MNANTIPKKTRELHNHHFDSTIWNDFKFRDGTVPLGGAFWDGGAQSLINNGMNGRWREVLQPSEIEKYDIVAARELPTACAKWLASGIIE